MGALTRFYRETLAEIRDYEEKITEICRYLDLDARVANIRLLAGYALAAEDRTVRVTDKRRLTHPPGYFAKPAVAERSQALEKFAESGKRALVHLSNALAFYEQWRLSDGTRLGDATKDKLLYEATVMEAKGTGMLRKAEFYKLLAKRMKGDGKLSKFVTEDQATSLRDHVFGQEPQLQAAE